MYDETDKINSILGIDDAFKAPMRLMEILLDKQVRESIFAQFLGLVNYKLDKDFWHIYYQEETAQRKKLKQDFTPMSVSRLATQLASNGEDSGMRFEAAAGTGGMTIAMWALDRARHMPWNYKPSQYLYVCEELSDRAFPFLVFNMVIRGMNGAAVHCDSLTRDCHGVFFIQNDDEHPAGFSNINVLPYSKDTEEFFNVTFTRQKYRHHIESSLNLFGRGKA